MIKCNCSLCIRVFFLWPFDVLLFFFSLESFLARSVCHIVYEIFSPVCLLFVVVVGVIDKKSHCSNWCEVVFFSLVERFVFTVQLSRDAQSPNPYKSDCVFYFIKVETIHFTLIRCSSFSFRSMCRKAMSDHSTKPEIRITTDKKKINWTNQLKMVKMHPWDQNDLFLAINS